MNSITLLLFATMTLVVVPAFGQEPNGELSTIVKKSLTAASRADDTTAMSRACIGRAATACMETPARRTTLGMPNCAFEERRWWNSLLNFRFGELKKRLSANAFVSIRNVQRKWITFREADCEFVYLHLYGNGSLRTPATAWCLLDATPLRTIRLGGLIEKFQGNR